ncbi:MAG: hypothetical protein ACH37Z_11450 [Anaerolineae bacterium]
MIDEQLILPLEARTTTAMGTSAAFRARAGRGLVLLIDVTAKASTPNISAVAIQVKGPAGTWATVYTWTGLTIADAGLFKFCVYPGAASAATWTAAPLQGPIPARDLRVVLTHDDTDSITYAVAAVFPA